jgi:hypothetical protein
MVSRKIFALRIFSHFSAKRCLTVIGLGPITRLHRRGAVLRRAALGGQLEEIFGAFGLSVL